MFLLILEKSKRWETFRVTFLCKQNLSQKSYKENIETLPDPFSLYLPPSPPFLRNGQKIMKSLVNFDSKQFKNDSLSLSLMVLIFTFC